MRRGNKGTSQIKEEKKKKKQKIVEEKNGGEHNNPHCRSFVKKKNNWAVGRGSMGGLDQ